jgi:tRNA G10  N-methylase Trm11
VVARAGKIKTKTEPVLVLVPVQVTSRSLVMDPYVGTGSILVAAAARGAATFGSDIDHR